MERLVPLLPQFRAATRRVVGGPGQRRGRRSARLTAPAGTRSRRRRPIPHDLWRTYASDLLDAGTDLPAVLQLMDHASPSTTSRHDRRDDRARRAAAERLPLLLGGCGSSPAGLVTGGVLRRLTRRKTTSKTRPMATGPARRRRPPWRSWNRPRHPAPRIGGRRCTSWCRGRARGRRGRWRRRRRTDPRRSLWRSSGCPMTASEECTTWRTCSSVSSAPPPVAPASSVQAAEIRAGGGSPPTGRRQARPGRGRARAGRHRGCPMSGPSIGHRRGPLSPARVPRRNRRLS